MEKTKEQLAAKAKAEAEAKAKEIAAIRYYISADTSELAGLGQLIWHELREGNVPPVERTQFFPRCGLHRLVLNTKAEQDAFTKVTGGKGEPKAFLTLKEVQERLRVWLIEDYGRQPRPLVTKGKGKDSYQKVMSEQRWSKQIFKRAEKNKTAPWSAEAKLNLANEIVV